MNSQTHIHLLANKRLAYYIESYEKNIMVDELQRELLLNEVSIINENYYGVSYLKD